MAGRRHVSIRQIGTSRVFNESFNEDRCSGLQRPSSIRAGIFEKNERTSVFFFWPFSIPKLGGKKVSVCNGNSGQVIGANKYEWRKNMTAFLTKKSTVPGRDVYKLLYPVIIPFFTIHIRDFSKR